MSFIRIKVEVEAVVDVGPYGDEWNVGDAKKQAVREALQKVDSALQGMRENRCQVAFRRVSAAPKVSLHFEAPERDLGQIVFEQGGK